ncbi:hypothetical protein MN116_006711 [Schistosoma mekongi]|uniref:C2 domain-containing protein n=1 Tax=Schistosoma mekongi TaxID=38744 RepID=A0AAE1Z8F5_SCHME|nr:hypothetical protein MN116_006711 [Schistosoma mekongi]
MIPLNSNFSLLSLSNKLHDNEVDNQINAPIDYQNGILAMTECYDHLYWQGQLQLALHTTDNCIRIHIIQARYLQVPVDEGYCMFVEIRIAPRNSPHCNTYQLRTKSVPDCTAPVFNEKFSLFNNQNSIFLGGMSFDIHRLKQKFTEIHSSIDNSINFSKASIFSNLHLYETYNHSTLSLPSLIIDDNDVLKPQWYYLLSQKFCYRRHISMDTVIHLSKLGIQQNISSLQSIKLKSKTIPSKLTNVLISSKNVSTLSSRNFNDNLHLPELTGFKRMKITIPKSESGYGFTVTHQMTGFDFKQFASTPLNSPSTHQDTVGSEGYNSLPIRKCFRIHSVQEESPADQVGLPVGAYILGIGNTRLNCSMTLKEVLKCISDSAESHPNKAIILDICIPDSCKKVKSYYPSGQNSDGELNSLVSCSPQSKINRNMCIDTMNNNIHHFNNTDDFSKRLSYDNCNITTSSTAEHLVTDSSTKANDDFHLPQNITTTAGSVMLCEECCIDEGILHNDNDNNRNGSLTQRTRLLTLAPPLLNLKWQDVCVNEANRQWAIEALIIKLINVSNDLIYGIKAYRTGLQNISNLHTEDLNRLFHNIVEISYQTCKMKQNLQNGCLPYAISSNISSSPSTSDPVIKRSNKSKSRPSFSLTTSSSLNFKDDSSKKLNNHLYKDNKNNNNTPPCRSLQKRHSFLSKLRRSFVSGYSSPFHRENSKSNNNHFDMNDGRGIEQFYSQYTEQGKQIERESSYSLSARSYSLHSSSPPIHGHLDNPGTIVLLSLNNLLNECMDYTNVYPDRLKFIYELRKRYPDLRLFLKNQAMEPGVPILSLFLTLPSEIPRYLLSGLKNIEKFTSDQHKDRPALEKCIQTLSDALTCQPFSNATTKDIVNLDNLVLKDMSSLSNSQFVENDYQKVQCTPPSPSSAHIQNVNKQKQSTMGGFENFVLNQEKLNDYENSQLAKLMKYILPPLFPYPNELLTFNPLEWSSIHHHIIYKSYLTCTLCSKQYPDLIVDDTSYRGPVFAYLLNDAILLVVSENDILDTCRPSCLAYEPILFTSISFQDYEISALSFMLILVNGTTMKFTCSTLEIKLVWKTLIQQQILINNKCS